MFGNWRNPVTVLSHVTHMSPVTETNHLPHMPPPPLGPQPGTKGHPSFNSTPPRIPYAAYVAHSGEGPGKGFMASSTTSHLNYMHKHEIRVPFPSSLQTSLAKTLFRGTRPAASCLLHYILPTGQKSLVIFRLTIGLHPKGTIASVNARGPAEMLLCRAPAKF